jgi:eukaryotic-like serine/threonine-protein kinase
MLGTTISHYRILSKLGSGGMGVVYEAQDLTLGRRVALKFLPPELARDQSALDRFLLEARSASALNHPNICTIHAVENADGQSFIAMELLEGQNLALKLLGPALPLDRLLDISIQLADALEAAHAKGIIHRDIKPANIFLTPRGQVKVLDFGLAKLAHTAETVTVGVTEDLPAHLTSPGSTVGTIAYMSPEQARGEELDPRTDLFSLGAVIYQMATGRLPFPGNTSAVIFNGILERTPVPPAEINPALPAKLQEVISKLLEKDRDLRCQTAAELRGDLKRLKRDLDSTRTGAVSDKSSATIAVARPSGSQAFAVAASASSQITAAARQHRVGLMLGTFIVLILLAAAGYGIYSFLSRNRALPFANISIAKVTESGNTLQVAMSPDGKYIATVVDDNGQQGLFLRNLPTKSYAPVIPPTAQSRYAYLRFSPDGNYIYFERSEAGNISYRYLYRTPVLGGTPEKILGDIDSNITFSPDGRRFAYVVWHDPEVGKYRLVVHSLEDGKDRTLASGPIAKNFRDPVWSPDGKVIVCVVNNPGNAISGLTAVNVDTGKQDLFFTSDHFAFVRPEWLSDSRGILILIQEQLSSFERLQIAVVSYPGGKLRAVTHDTNSYDDLTNSADGRTIAALLNEPRDNLFIASTDPERAPARQATSSASVLSFAWMKDARFLLGLRSGFTILDTVATTSSLLGTGEASSPETPSACRDGHYVVFSALAASGSGTRNIWRMNADGGDVAKLTSGRNDAFPVCSPDGRWVIYGEDIRQGGRLMRVPLQGGTSEPLSQVPIVSQLDVSPDGTLAVFVSFGLDHPGTDRIAVVDIASGQTRKLLNFETPHSTKIQFARDGQAVVYVSPGKGVDNLWLQPLVGSAGHQLTAFDSLQILDFHWSLDGKQLGLVRGHTDSDVVLIRDVQQ